MLDCTIYDRQKVVKSRTPKSKHRQSPYPPVCDARDFTSDFENNFKPEIDLSVQIPSLQGIHYSPSFLTNAHAQDALLERYQLYSSYANPIPAGHSLKDCVYSSPPPHIDSGQFRVACDDKFPVRDSDFLQLSTNSHSDPKLDEAIHLTSLSREMRPNGRCSRSSSRGEAFVASLPLHETHSNRSESSISDVDVISDDMDPGKAENKQCSKLPKDRTNVPNEPVQQSVIMRMPNQNSSLCQSPGYSCDYSKSNLSKSPRTAHTDIVKYSSEQGNSPNGNFFPDDPNEKLYEGIKHINKTYGDDPIMQCLRTNFTYDSSNAGIVYPTSGLQGKPYPVMPQAGYTSVIVDTHQYQVANGFVH